MDYDVLIIGAGPGGIFTAYELTTKAEHPLKVGVFELGNPLDERRCPIDGDKIKIGDPQEKTVGYDKNLR